MARHRLRKLLEGILTIWFQKSGGCAREKVAVQATFLQLFLGYTGLAAEGIINSYRRE